MDIDKLIKINNLSKELQRHGIAASALEAVQQACVVVEESPEQEAVLVMEQKEPVQESSKVVLSPLQERRFELILEANNRRHDQEIAALRATIASMSTQLEQLRLEMKTVNERQLQAGMPKKVDKQEMLKTEVKENHPRQGAFKPGDETVSIEKIFYFGTGRAKF